ncbi:hypothetical protein GH714_008105 [Hevea brasiliensis]|uniref:Uncharacterized protein n=1 Tax=Hevea brasiliensis TaxID=3981 RepID=A0A6A6KYR4_HEVBR|nr:hypothetical protein GH714_008105 [Hevea brasiliensis]
MLDKTVFPSLCYINLKSLPSLTRFYSGSEAIKCPSLEKIEAADCLKIKIFTSTFSGEQDSTMIVEGNKDRVYKEGSDIPIVHFLNGKANTLYGYLGCTIKKVEDVNTAKAQAYGGRRIPAPSFSVSRNFRIAGMLWNESSSAMLIIFREFDNPGDMEM